MFRFKTNEIRAKYLAFVRSLTGQEPCVNNSIIYTPSNTKSDFYTSEWASSNLTKEEAQALCAPCPLIEMCRDYAVAAKEPYGIWGGTRRIDRGYSPHYRGHKEELD